VKGTVGNLLHHLHVCTTKCSHSFPESSFPSSGAGVPVQTVTLQTTTRSETRTASQPSYNQGTPQIPPEVAVARESLQKKLVLAGRKVVELRNTVQGLANSTLHSHLLHWRREKGLTSIIDLLLDPCIFENIKLQLDQVTRVLFMLASQVKEISAKIPKQDTQKLVF
jgi:hypothetical protein